MQTHGPKSWDSLSYRIKSIEYEEKGVETIPYLKYVFVRWTGAQKEEKVMRWSFNGLATVPVSHPKWDGGLTCVTLCYVRREISEETIRTEAAIIMIPFHEIRTEENG